MSDPDLPLLWRRIRAGLRNAVSDSSWHIWLEPLSARELTGHDGRELVIEAPDALRSWVQGHFARLLQACAAAVIGPEARVTIVAPGAPAAVASPGGDGASGLREGAPAAPRGLDVNPRLTFEQFVIGDGNRLAHAAALAVAELPGLAYNPLFICGRPGLGKTHLLHAIANYVRTHGGGLTVRMTTAEAFTDHFVGALHSKAIEAFKAAYRGVDVLLVDDVQFLERKARTEEEFFHTFNALHQAGAQIVLTSDRVPRDMSALEDRLRERFEAGLVCDVAAPDLSTRLTILRKRVAQDDVGAVDPAALELIAERIDANVRALEGALIRVVAFGSLTGRSVDRELTREVLDELYPDSAPRRRRQSLEDIQRQVCEAFGIELTAMLSTSRAANVTWPRQVAMYLARELTDATLPAIGRAFGGRNHTTVLHACRKTAERMAADREAYDAVHRLMERLSAA